MDLRVSQFSYYLTLEALKCHFKQTLKNFPEYAKLWSWEISSNLIIPWASLYPTSLMDLITQFIIRILHREANMMLAKHCSIFHFTEKERHCTCDIILCNNPLIREPYKESQFKVLFSQRKTPRVWLFTSPSPQCFIKLWSQISFYHQAKVSHLGVGWNKDTSLQPCIRIYLVFSPEEKWKKNYFLQAGYL